MALSPKDFVTIVNRHFCFETLLKLKMASQINLAGVPLKKLKSNLQKQGKTVNNLISELQFKCERLAAFAQYEDPPHGGLSKCLNDFEDIVNNAPKTVIAHYGRELMSYCIFVREEAWLLNNGECIHSFQKEEHKAYILDGFDSLATSEMNRTTRHTPGCKVTVCSTDGILFLIKKKELVRCFHRLHCVL